MPGMTLCASSCVNGSLMIRPSVYLFESEVTDSAPEYAQAGDAVSSFPVKYQGPKIASLELIPHQWNQFPRGVPVSPQHQASVLDRKFVCRIELFACISAGVGGQIGIANVDTLDFGASERYLTASVDRHSHHAV